MIAAGYIRDDAPGPDPRARRDLDPRRRTLREAVPAEPCRVEDDAGRDVRQLPVMDEADAARSPADLSEVGVRLERDCHACLGRGPGERGVEPGAREGDALGEG
jgi:hypothetical protein